jgi:replicative DNA helicase
MGKTSMVLALARNAAVDFQKPVALFSLEMSSLQFAQRLISMEAEIEGGKLRNGKLEPYEWTQLHTAIEKLADIPIYIDDTPGINIFELRAKCRRLKMQHNIQMVIIDYLQLMSGSSGDGKNSNREQEISNISRALKGMAKELSVPVIALSQLSRAVETRGGSKKPQLSDLRESGAIEQDADMVTFIYRPEYYGILEDENGASLKGVAELIIAKHRHGALDTVKLKFMADYAKFANLDDPNFSDFNNASFTSDPYSDSQAMRFQSKMNNDDIPF